MKKVLLIIVLILIIGAGAYYYFNYGAKGGNNIVGTSNIFNNIFGGGTNTNNITIDFSKPDAYNGTYLVEGNVFNLINGFKSNLFSDTGEEYSVSIVGTPAYGDLDQDGDVDAAVTLLVQYKKGEKAYYAALLMNNDDTDKSTSGLLLGQKIDPKSIVIVNGKAVYNLLIQAPNSLDSADPTVLTSIWVDYSSIYNDITQVLENVEGDYNPDEMSLNMKQWEWLYTMHSDNSITSPGTSKRFTLSITGSNTFNATADCNVVGGKFTKTTDKQITFSDMQGTRLSCTRSVEDNFWEVFEDAQSYRFTSKGELIFTLRAGKGEAYFR